MSKHWPITHFGTDYNMQAFERTSDLEKDPDANRNKIIIIHISRRVGGGKHVRLRFKTELYGAYQQLTLSRRVQKS